MRVIHPHKLDDLGHAVDRWLERHREGVERAAAEAELLGLLPSAIFVEAVESEKQCIWRLSTGALAVVDETGMVRTVLPEGTVKKRYRPKK